MVESFTYTQADVAKARQEILGYIREHGIDLVVGSSLGGFIALTLSGIPRIVVLIYGEFFAFFLHLHLHLQKKELPYVWDRRGEGNIIIIYSNIKYNNNIYPVSPHP